MTKGLPPNTKVKIELDRSDDKFVIMSEESDNEEYQMKILNICLYVPVAELSQTVFQEINTLITGKKKQLPFIIAEWKFVPLRNNINRPILFLK